MTTIKIFYPGGGSIEYKGIEIERPYGAPLPEYPLITFTITIMEETERVCVEGLPFILTETK